MAATPLTMQSVDHLTAVTIGVGTAADTVNGNSVANGGFTVLWMNNTDVGSQTVTFAVPVLVDGLAVATRVVTLAAGAQKLMKMGPPAVHGNPTVFTGSNAGVKFNAYAVSS
jgi:hypothetical protein